MDELTLVYRSNSTHERGSAAPARARRLLLAWYDRNARALPWRRTSDPYRILVSEVMAQQTQIARVVPAYRAFIRAFPTVRALARASRADVIRAWAGLGYNRRAVNLHRAAQQIAAAGTFPRTIDGLRALPGIGDYTAAAVACFAFGARIAAFDVNAHRVVARAGLGEEPSPANRARARALADAWLAPRRAADHNQALMDLGATICVARAPRCDACPLERACPSRGRPRPTPTKRTERFEGSTRQARGEILRTVRATGSAQVAVLPARPDLPRLLMSMEDQGLVVCTPAAREGKPAGRVSLPR